MCGCRQTLILASQQMCRQCASQAAVQANNVTEHESPVPQPAASAARHGRGPRTADAVIDEKKLGSFAEMPARSLWLVVPGIPQTQGSMKAVAAGVMKRHKGSQLVEWRTSIHRALVRAHGLDFDAADCPVRLHVCFTVPGPPSGIAVSHTRKANPDDPGRPRVIPSTRPDLDKLERAVGDALSPLGDRVKAYTEDGRIAELLAARSYPAPEHVHPWALPVPGAVIRVCPADTDAQFPALTLRDPGPPSADLQTLIERAVTTDSAPERKRGN